MPTADPLDRRTFLSFFAGLGVACPAFPVALWEALRKDGEITGEAVARAEELIGLEFSADERELMLRGLKELRESYQRIREVRIDNTVPPALRFDPSINGGAVESKVRGFRAAEVAMPELPDDLEELAFLPVVSLSRLIRSGKVSSVDLTRLYLGRLKRFDPLLHCVVTLTEERALAQAERLDRELAEGKWRGPLHGIPWGAKDLLAAKGYPTTWGATPFKDQVIDEDATVVHRLDEAGAVLVAKLTLGALAWGDVWFGGKTRSPWNTEEGSSGSSAGPGSATAAGLVGFSIGSETWGSIVSPSTACGVTGLRPSFGRVSRHGAMALSWSMDKLGPMCRCVEDCALVLRAIAGPDGKDPTAVEQPFDYSAELDVTKLRVGYVEALFEPEGEPDERRKAQLNRDRRVLDELRALGCTLVPIALPDFPVSALSFILSAEAAAAFDELTRSGRDEELVRQVDQAWPNVFRQARLIPAVEYLQANRARTLLMRDFEKMLEGIDAYVAPSFGGDNLLLTNLTGHPAVVMPNGFRENGLPSSITFTGRLFREGELLALARAWQESTDWHRRRPPLPA